MNNFKITIIGNSVGLRVRPPLDFPDNKNYGQILEDILNERMHKHNVYVKNMSIHRGLVYEILDQIDKFIRTFPQYYIINLGVCDASTREVPLWFSNQISRKSHGFLHNLCSLIYFNIIKKFRRPLVKLRNNTPWESEKYFSQKYHKLLSILTKETNAKIITMPINKTTNRVEKQIPGSSNNFHKYSNIIKNATYKYNYKFINLSNLEPDKHCPDGIHFSGLGHKLVADRQAEIILNN